jgi:DNA repair exonuclease SbcCD nuclease subunit
VGGRRLRGQMETLELLFKQAHASKVPLFFNGDLFHSPIGLTNDLLSVVLPEIIQLFHRYPIDFFAISGNHDIEGINTKARRSPSYINTLANSIETFHNLDFETVEFDDFAVHGIPYLTHNTGFAEAVEEIKIVKGKFNILMNHGDYKDQKDTNGIIIGKGENVDEDLLEEKFDLVLSGHVHKQGHIRKNIYSLGSPMQHRLSDMGGTFGYWSLKNKFRLEFKELLDTPKFRFYTKDSDKDNDIDFWVKEVKGDAEVNEMLEDELDFQDQTEIGRQYLNHVGVTARSKRALLKEILTEIADGEW